MSKYKNEKISRTNNNFHNLFSLRIEKMSLTLFDIILALIIGSLTGLVLQRGRVCTNTAFRNLLLIRNSEITLIIIITVLVELIGYQTLALLSIPGFSFQSNPLPFSFLLLPVGGFIFGFGTVIAGGCAGGVCYRIGEGSIKSLLAFIGFAAGIGILYMEPLNSIVGEFRNSTKIVINGQIPTLELIIPRWGWTIGAILLLIGLIYYSRRQTSQLKHLLPNWTPFISGLILGIIGTIARYSSTLTGRSFGFSTTDGIGQLFSLMIDPNALGWAGLFVIGLIIGAGISSIQLKEFKLKVPNKMDIFRFFGGGIMLGIGAMLAMGCNFGHILGGIPELGISSVVAVIVMILGNWTGSHLLYNIMHQEIPESTPILI